MDVKLDVLGEASHLPQEVERLVLPLGADNDVGIVDVVVLCIEGEDDVFPSMVFVAGKPSTNLTCVHAGNYIPMGNFCSIQCFGEGPYFTLSSE